MATDMVSLVRVSHRFTRIVCVMCVLVHALYVSKYASYAPRQSQHMRYCKRGADLAADWRRDSMNDDGNI